MPHGVTSPMITPGAVPIAGEKTACSVSVIASADSVSLSRSGTDAIRS